MPAASARRRTALWVILIAAAALLYGRGLARYQIDDDEEGYAYAAWRTSQMEVPYRDFLTPQLPAFLYPAAVVTRIAGRDLGALRAWSVVLVLAAGGAVFITGRSLLGSLGGALAAALFLAAEDVFSVGRAFRPEATMLAATTMATALLATGEARRMRAAYAGAGLFFAVGLLAKLFAALPWSAAVAYVAWEAVRRRRTVSAAAGDVALLIVPGLLLVCAVMGAFVLVWPETLDAVLGHHLRQGADLGWTAVAAKTLVYFRSAVERNAILLAFVPAGVVGLLVVGGPRAGIVVWQLPTIVAFFLLTRDLYHRHLVVLFPALALCAAGGLVWFVRAAGQSRLAVLGAASVAGALWLALAIDSLDTVRTAEFGTASVAALSRALVEPGKSLLSDTPGPAFHAGRTTTRSAAGLSAGAALSGQITGAQLLDEIRAAGSSAAEAPLPRGSADADGPESESGSVDLILLDASPAAGHLRILRDYETFAEALTGGSGDELSAFERVGYARRSDITYDVLRRRAAPPLGAFADVDLLAARQSADGPDAPRRDGARAATLVDLSPLDFARGGPHDLVAPLQPQPSTPGASASRQVGGPPNTGDPDAGKMLVDLAWLKHGSSHAANGPGAPGVGILWRVLCEDVPVTLANDLLETRDVACAEGSSPLVDLRGRAPGEWEIGEVVGASYRLVLPPGVRAPYRIQLARDPGAGAEPSWADAD